MSRPSLGRKRYLTYMSTHLIKQLDAYAEHDGVARTDLLDQALKDYIASRKRHDRFVKASMPAALTPSPQDKPGDGDL